MPFRWRCASAGGPRSAAGCANRFEAQVLKLAYLGRPYPHAASRCVQDSFVLKVAHTAGPRHLGPGESVGVGFAVEDCRAFDEA